MGLQDQQVNQGLQENLDHQVLLVYQGKLDGLEKQAKKGHPDLLDLKEKLVYQELLGYLDFLVNVVYLDCL